MSKFRYSESVRAARRVSQTEPFGKGSEDRPLTLMASFPSSAFPVPGEVIDWKPTKAEEPSKVGRPTPRQSASTVEQSDGLKPLSRNLLLGGTPGRLGATDTGWSF